MYPTFPEPEATSLHVLLCPTNRYSVYLYSANQQIFIFERLKEKNFGIFSVINIKICSIFTCRHDCEDIWRQFEEAVVRQSSCNVTVEDYHQMFYAMPQTWPCDRVSRSKIFPPKSDTCPSFFTDTSLDGKPLS